MYLSVLMVSVLVSLLGMSALVVKRVQRRNHQSSMDASQARFIAQSALRIGMLDIENDPNWRYNFPNGTWKDDVALLGGKYTLEAYDPSDGDLANNPEEPVVLVATGVVGSARQKTQLTLTPVNRGYSFLEKALVSQHDIKVEENTYLYCNQILASNHDFDAQSGSSIVADVEAENDVKGSGTYYGTTEEEIQQEAFPETDDILSYYLARGTEIDYSSIQDKAVNIIKNDTFETNIDLWEADSCSISKSESWPYAGASNLLCSNRNSVSDAVTYDVTNRIAKGETYNLTFWGRSSGITYDAFSVIIETDASSSGVQQVVANTGLMMPYWVQYTVSLSPNWSGTLNSAKIRIQTRYSSVSFNIDNVSFKEPDPPAGTIYKRVISPNHNPYGETNPDGIYFIDCGGSALGIDTCRILGTLVVLDSGDSSQIYPGPIAWSTVEPNFPCLLVDGKFNINATSDGLNETRDEVNYNPIGAAHNTLGEDDDIVDTIPSKISGLIYVSDDLVFDNQANIEGVVLGGNKITIEDTFSLVYNSIFFTNPPPGFSAPETIRILLNSVQKPLD
ncbi:Carbohydrate binding domain protein [Polystyrenella longa]|uniref:Carbohydrate binding domain protein n=1 Tax=Polystyrenella longa TaxID=2528007 RepID=A0A518CRP2_9PLAN|nr:carbohydrate binding domain-containing protein [Polystyrenella longa]QDU81899.1 Carbohydrate binding domain protein [Polystyrenella longa]